jgi:hypothetical protein
MKRLLTALAIFPMLAMAALAQSPDTTVSVPLQPFADAILPTVGTLLLAVVGWGFRKLPESVVAVLRTARVEQLLARAIDYGINTVKGASKDKVLDVNVGNAVVAQAARKAVEWAPKWMAEWLGGEKGIRERIIARLELSPEAGADPGAVIQGPIPSA